MIVVKVTVDTTTCTGHGRCYSLAPAVFESDDEGHSVLLVETVEGELLVAAQRAAANCPERAISVGD